jgi:hypothetical protein
VRGSILGLLLHDQLLLPKQDLEAVALLGVHLVRVGVLLAHAFKRAFDLAVVLQDGQHRVHNPHGEQLLLRFQGADREVGHLVQA